MYTLIWISQSLFCCLRADMLVNNNNYPAQTLLKTIFLFPDAAVGDTSSVLVLTMERCPTTQEPLARLVSSLSKQTNHPRKVGWLDWYTGWLSLLSMLLTIRLLLALSPTYLHRLLSCRLSVIELWFVIHNHPPPHTRTGLLYCTPPPHTPHTHTHVQAIQEEKRTDKRKYVVLIIITCIYCIYLIKRPPRLNAHLV